MEYYKEKDFARASSNTNALICIEDALHDIFEKAITSAYPDVPDPPVDINITGKNPKFGDYQCNSAMSLSQYFRKHGIYNS